MYNFSERFPTEESCREFLLSARWNGTPKCPHCENTDLYYLQTRESYRCKNKACNSTFNVRTGTVLSNTKLPLKKWLFAFYIICCSKNGMSSPELAKHLGITQKTAYYLAIDIRKVLNSKMGRVLMGTVEVDECYLGGKHRGGKRGRGSESKTPVFGMFQRNPKSVRMFVVPNAKKRTLWPIIKKNLRRGSFLMSDELTSYRGLGKYFVHEAVNHGTKEYARPGGIHVNHIERQWRELKAMIIGTHRNNIHRSKLQLYCSEAAFRYNNTHVSFEDRIFSALKSIQLK